MNDTDDAKAQVPTFLMETPFDTSVARRVKRAYSSLDAISIRTGLFLRRNPLVRILVLIYMVSICTKRIFALIVICKLCYIKDTFCFAGTAAIMDLNSTFVFSITRSALKKRHVSPCISRRFLNK